MMIYKTTRRLFYHATRVPAWRRALYGKTSDLEKSANHFRTKLVLFVSSFFIVSFLLLNHPTLACFFSRRAGKRAQALRTRRKRGGGWFDDDI